MRNYSLFSVYMAFIMLLVNACIIPAEQAEVKPGQYSYLFKKDNGRYTKIKYLLYIPDTYIKSKEEWPLILFLHGVGERGNNVRKVKREGLPELIARKKKKLPFIILSPQCPRNGWWSSTSQIEDINVLLDHVVSKYRVDEKRIYATGLSMGGFGTWQLAATYPDRFAAIAPICGVGNPEDAKKIAHIPIWVFHGEKDEIVPIKASEDMVEALKKAGSQVKFTVYPEIGHDSWTVTYKNPELYKWFLQHSLSKGVTKKYNNATDYQILDIN